MVASRFNRPNRFAPQQQAQAQVAELLGQLLNPSAGGQPLFAPNQAAPANPLVTLYRYHEGVFAVSSDQNNQQQRTKMSLDEVREYLDEMQANKTFAEGRWTDRQGNSDPCFRGTLNGIDVVITCNVIKALALNQDAAPERETTEVPLIAALRSRSGNAQPQPEAEKVRIGGI